MQVYSESQRRSEDLQARLEGFVTRHKFGIFFCSRGSLVPLTVYVFHFFHTQCPSVRWFK
jgi:hypothetical protein